MMGVACQMKGMGIASNRHRLSGGCRCGGHSVGDGNVIKVVVALFVMGMEQKGEVEFCDRCGHI